jgi:hypothetical protein
MAQSVKLPDQLMALVRQESQLTSRSVAGQIAHWVRIGRAIERSGAFDYQRIMDALRGEKSPDELGPEEQEVWLDRFSEALDRPTEEEEAFFERRKRLGLGVGLSKTGELVYAKEEGHK